MNSNIIPSLGQGHSAMLKNKKIKINEVMSKEHRSAKYQYLVLTGKLTEYLNQVDKEARENDWSKKAEAIINLVKKDEK